MTRRCENNYWASKESTLWKWSLGVGDEKSRTANSIYFRHSWKQSPWQKQFMKLWLMILLITSSEVFLLMIQRLSLLDCRQSDWQKSVILGLTTIDGLQKPLVILHQPQTKTSKLKRRKRRRIMRRKTSTDWGKTGQSQVHRQHLTECNRCQPPPPTINREVTFPCICRCKVGTERVQNWNW